MTTTILMMSCRSLAIAFILAISIDHQVECLKAVSSSSRVELSRRTFWGQAAAVAFVGMGVEPALATSQEETDKTNILKGYKRLNYLLDHWEEETTVCKTGNDNPYLGCDRTPLKVMDYLGFKSTDDPLFKAEKTMRRLEALVPADLEGEYQDAVDMWVEKAEEGSGMAYVSSWGEANPGGGKDRVELFIERSRKDVVACRDSLASIVRILNLE